MDAEPATTTETLEPTKRPTWKIAAGLLGAVVVAGGGYAVGRSRGGVTLQAAAPLAELAQNAVGQVNVRGHVRSQPYGPGRTLRKPVEIAPYPRRLPAAA